jgi:hypothetical protein
MCEESWSQYRDCNHEAAAQVPRRVSRCGLLEAGADPRHCPQYRFKKRRIRVPDACWNCRQAGVVEDEGIKMRDRE